ncbi:MAG: AbrB/MazE/SpoVT family DNA-binding domain-containing protein [Cyanobacteriota bacterium]|nr:AbrB/MazE/SpoVT family DNA-binding domain-containing protein [Cyanobacteriota bacterium]
MEKTHLSSQGKVLIPKQLRLARCWNTGQELIAIEVGDGILLKPKKPFEETTLGQVAGCLKYREQPKTLDELESAVGEGILEQWHDFR